MGFLLMFAAFIVLGLCLAENKTERRGFLGAVAAILYFPIGVILALTKNYT